MKHKIIFDYVVWFSECNFCFLWAIKRVYNLNFIAFKNRWIMELFLGNKYIKYQKNNQQLKIWNIHIFLGEVSTFIFGIILRECLKIKAVVVLCDEIFSKLVVIDK